MKFAFLIHPLSSESRKLLRMETSGDLQSLWADGNLLELCNQVQNSLAMSAAVDDQVPAETTVIDELKNLTTAHGKSAEGRLYEIPLGAYEILSDPHAAMRYIEQAVEMAAEWGAGIIGLGSMTGIIGGQGTYLAKHSPVPVTTGNSLTVYAALENLYHACRDAGIDPRQETVAVIGVPGSIATATARVLAPQVGELLLVARRQSTRARRLADSLDAELLLEIPDALARAKLVVSATSTGNCIDQFAIRSGGIVIDVGVPADVQGSAAARDDVLILSGGLTQLPSTMGRESIFLQFQFGIIPSCLGETINLALEQRAECYSLGRDLSPEHIAEIGSIARNNGFDFNQLLSFGRPVEDSTWANFLKVVTQQRLQDAAAAKLARANRNGNDGAGNDGAGNDGAGNGASLLEDKRQRGDSRQAALLQHVRGVLPDIDDLAPRAIGLHHRYINPVMVDMARQAGLSKVFVRGEGNHVWDDAGRKFLDFVAGFGSLNLGHNHPSVVAAVSKALTQHAPGFAQSNVNPYAATLAERLVALSPAGLEMVFFCNSGTEAVEAAIKLARVTSGRKGMLSCAKSYHGKTVGALSVTGNQAFQKPFWPLLPDCETIAYGDVAALERALTTRRYAAFVVEPVQGEGGMITPPANYLRTAQQLCHETGTLLIVDEVQTGLGRTGTLFACEHERVEPDMMTLAKSLGGGLMPIGAMLARRDVWTKAYGTVDSFALHTSTFGGGSLACAAALATLETLCDGGLVDDARARGRQLLEGLRQIQKDTGDYIRDVRGHGLMMGVELEALTPSVGAHIQRADASGLLQYMSGNFKEMLDSMPTVFQMQMLCEHHGIYTQVARSNPRVLRIQPPLTINEQQVSQFLDAFRSTCDAGRNVERLFDMMISKSVSGHHEASVRSSHAQSKVKIDVADAAAASYGDATR